jgi:hypothetical protein
VRQGNREGDSPRSPAHTSISIIPERRGALARYFPSPIDIAYPQWLQKFFEHHLTKMTSVAWYAEQM